MNTKFEYLYRDGSNYKSWGEVVFAGVCSADLRARLVKSLESSEFFMADQVRIPELFFEDRGLYADNHCWHELSNLVDTAEEPTDRHRRKFEDVVLEFETARRVGWRIFDRLERQLKFSQ